MTNITASGYVRVTFETRKHTPSPLSIPERLLDAAIVCNILPLGVDAVQVESLPVHLHGEVGVLV